MYKKYVKKMQQTDKHRLPTTKNHATDEQNDRLPTDIIICIDSMGYAY